jgi:hypothetical protein
MKREQTVELEQFSRNNINPHTGMDKIKNSDNAISNTKSSA